MKRSTNHVIAAVVVGIASLAMRPLIPAQTGGADTHGVPTTTGAQAENQKTVPVKVTKHEYDTKKLLSGQKLSEEAFAGSVLWQQRCAFCHDGMGQPTYKTMGPWIDSDTVKSLGPDAIKAFTMAGTQRMPGFKYDLDDKQMNSVIEFLKTVSPNLKPSPAQLAGKSQAPGNTAE